MGLIVLAVATGWIQKLRYRGLKKNTAQLHTLFALANLVIVKKALLVPKSAY